MSTIFCTNQLDSSLGVILYQVKVEINSLPLVNSYCTRKTIMSYLNKKNKSVQELYQYLNITLG